MTSEEIARDLTIAWASRAEKPTAEEVSATYEAILSKLGESKKVITLESIEKHLTKQESQNVLITALIFGASLVTAGNAMIVNAAIKLDFAPETIRDWGWFLVILGVILAILIFLIFKRRSY